MIIAMNIWLAFNVVFGLWTARNIFIRIVALCTGGNYKQRDLGVIMDLCILTSIVAYVISV